MISGVWMDEREKAIIEKHLSLDATVMEWGSGGSTIEFSKKVKKYYSVEHNQGWYNKVKEAISPNTTLYYRPVNKIPPEEPYYNQSTYEYYQNYVDIVYEIGEMFDMVLIDGRARRLCALKVIPYLKPNAVVIIHDWCLRPCYHCVLDYYDLIEKVDDTPQTIASFKLKSNWQDIKGYDINLGTFERLNR